MGMKNAHSATVRLSALLLALALLPACSSTSTNGAGPDASGTTATSRMPIKPRSGRDAVDREYLMVLDQIDREHRQAKEDARLKELGPAELVELEASFEAKRARAKADWQKARARFRR